MHSRKRPDNSGIDPAPEGTITVPDIRGDLHMHTTWSDGRNTVLEMARACVARGYEYIAITDHSRALPVARGLAPQRVRLQWAELDRVRALVPEIRMLRGLEVDILAGGRLDLPDEMLEQLDLVVVSVHSRLDLPRAQMTERVIRAMSHPAVDVLGHPTGRMPGRRKPSDVDIDAVLRAAAEFGVAVEINAQPHRLDLDVEQARRARELGVRIAIDTDAHTIAELAFMSDGVAHARQAGLAPADAINTLPRSEFLAWLARHRRLPDTA
jgi:DNA polymerase (family 10)